MTDLPNPLELLGKRVRYRGREGLVVGRLDPHASRNDRLAPFREESLTIRFEGQLGPTFVEVDGAELHRIELLEA